MKSSALRRTWPVPGWRRDSPFRRLSSSGDTFNRGIRCSDAESRIQGYRVRPLIVVAAAALARDLAPLWARFLPGPAAYLILGQAPRYRPKSRGDIVDSSRRCNSRIRQVRSSRAIAAHALSTRDCAVAFVVFAGARHSTRCGRRYFTAVEVLHCDPSMATFGT